MPVATAYPICKRLTTTSPDQGHEWLKGCYTDHQVRLFGPTSEFRLSHAMVDCGGFSVARLEHSMHARISLEPATHITVSEIIHGQYRIDDRNDDTAGKGDLLLYPSGQALASEWDTITTRLLRIPAARVATELGCDPADIQFNGLQPISVAAARHWRSLVRHVTHQILPVAVASALVRDATTRLLVATLLETFPIAAPQRVTSVWGAQAVALRAARWIEDNAHRPIGIPEIARAVRVSPTWLAQAFRMWMDTTPMGYLARVRMDGAHQELKRADPTTETVAAIAGRWGFGHAGRFAAAYRKRYRCPPSITLRT